MKIKTLFLALACVSALLVPLTGGEEKTAPEDTNTEQGPNTLMPEDDGGGTDNREYSCRHPSSINYCNN